MKIIRPILLMLLIVWASVAYGQSDLYNRYAKHNNLEVAYLKGFQVDSTLRIDVTIVIAQNNFAWRWLLRDIAVPYVGNEVKSQIRKGNNVGRMRLRSNQNLRLPPSKDMAKNCMISILRDTKTIVIYHLESEQQYQSIINILINKIEL